MGKQEQAVTGSTTRRISLEVLAKVGKYRDDLAAKVGVAPSERDVLEAAIVAGLAGLRAQAKLARR